MNVSFESIPKRAGSCFNCYIIVNHYPVWMGTYESEEYDFAMRMVGEMLVALDREDEEVKVVRTHG